MPIAYRVATVGTAAGVSSVEASSGSAVVREDVRPLVPAAKSGQLTTRTDANTGTLTMSGGHGITTGATIDVFWTGGSRHGMTVGTVATNSVPIDGGSGDDLPANLTAVTAMVPHAVPFTVNGDDAEFLAVRSPVAGYAAFYAGETELVAYRLSASSGKVWVPADGASPLAGFSTTEVRFSHGATAAKEMVAVALAPGVAAVPAIFDPSSLSNLTLWGEPGTNGSAFFQERTGASATTPAVIATDPVGTWKFQTGQYWTAPTDNTTRPLLTDFGGKLYPTADGVNDSLSAGDLSALFPSAGTVVLRFQITDDAATTVTAFQTANIDAYDRFFGSESDPAALRSARVESQPPIPALAWTTVVYRSSASGWTRRVDGVEDINTTAAYSAGTVWRMFAGAAAGVPARFMAGPFAFVAAYSDVKNDADCELLEDYAETVAPP